ncbi:Hcp family type VI secretion system effector [Paraburkholderia acidisoli]|jgi:type VI secretion system secreted protein Hcp|uniref:Hcp1 family type VI secretion system effector n=1 Tax=Paraburkholderia acidisoli TaxID=2571748 RepID=A0A7Z2GNJ8_9BURK|nr:type VI secretion system tube protein Hcp [Paraburkholderia acidisoli]QGZ64856.1 Hcp1 family type VI secretion system effector [Paraburkholderia acidisoli]
MDIVLLQIKDIKGNSTLEGATDQIVLDSFSFGLQLPMNHDVTNTERTLGRPTFNEFSFSKSTDLATPGLYSACAAGTKLGDATISVGRNENGTFMSLFKYVLSNAMISSVNTGGGGSSHDSFTINYTQVTCVYTQQNTDSTKKGNAPFGWDLTKNVAATPAAS